MSPFQQSINRVVFEDGVNTMAIYKESAAGCQGTGWINSDSK